MNVRKYFADTSREALRQVKQELGGDALILSNRAVEGGVEILALAAADAASILPASRAETSAPPAAALPQVAQRESISAATTAAASADASPGPSTVPRKPREFAAKATHEFPRLSTHSASASPAQSPSSEPVVRKIFSEIETMRGMLERQLAGLAWSDMQRREPVRAELMRDLLRAGFSASLARHVLEHMPADQSHAEGLQWSQAALGHNLRSIAVEDDIVEQGGTYAIIGPTGVGKTTTTAKIAARCVMRHGADKLALLTTDSYRIGGHEQLRLYGKILGTPVHAVKDAADLTLMLGELQHKHLVLIDTIGMSQRDKMMAEQAAMLANGSARIKRLLLLNATCGGDTLEDVVTQYMRGGIHGAIITKADEAASLGGVLDVLIRHRLTLHAVANGQRVPEDLQAPDSRNLLDAAFRPMASDSPHRLTDEEYPLLHSGLLAGRSVSAFVEV